ATGQTREATTNEDGTYTIQNLPPAVYEVKIEAAGFVSVVNSNVPVRVGEVTTIIGKLKPAGTTEVVEVQAEKVQGVDTSTTQVSGYITDLRIENLPLNGRNFLELAFLLPGNAPAP